MPSPYLYNRPSGRFVRVLVPLDLREALGQRFLIRSLGSISSDHARLAAAKWALDLARYFAQIREDPTMATRRKPEPAVPVRSIDDQVEALFRDVARSVKAKRLSDPQGYAEEFHTDELSPLLNKPPRDRGNGPKLYPALMSYRRLLEQRGTRPAYIQELMSAWDVWAVAVGDVPIDSVTDEDGRAFQDYLPRVPVNRNKHAALRDLMRLDLQVQRGRELGLPTISAASMDKLASRLRTFFATLQDLKRENPLDGLTFVAGGQRKAPKRQGFDNDELVRIFDPVHLGWVDQPHLYWGLWIGLLTGARAREIGQLRIDDLKTDRKTGIRYFQIVDWGPGQSVKNAGSRRTVPIHSALLAMGLDDYIQDVKAAKGDLLFPTIPWHSKAGYGDAVGDRAIYFLRNRVGINDPTKVFHSFRYTTVRLLRDGGVPGDRIGAITGHSPSELDPSISKALGEVYMREVSLERLQKDIEAMVVPVKLWPRYERGRFRMLFKRAIHAGTWCVKPKVRAKVVSG